MGMLLRPLDAILSSQSKVRLLRALLPLEEGVSAREASRLARVPFPAALRALADLTALGVLHRAELRSQHLYTVAHANPLVRDGLVALFESERQRIRSVFDWFRSALQDQLARGTVRSVIVYGSAARGEDRPRSDLDLLVVAASEDEIAEIHGRLARLAPELEHLYALDLAPVVVSEARLREQMEAGDPVTHAAVREGRVVAGESMDTLLPSPTES